MHEVHNVLATTQIDYHLYRRKHVQRRLTGRWHAFQYLDESWDWSSRHPTQPKSVGVNQYRYENKDRSTYYSDNCLNPFSELLYVPA